jgi:hypothetical protein
MMYYRKGKEYILMEVPSSCPSHHQGNAVDLQQTQVLSPHRCPQARQHEGPWFFDTLHEQWVITSHVLVKQMLLDTRLQARPLEQHDGAWLYRQQAPYFPQVLVREEIQTHPALLSTFVEELLRVSTPTCYVARWATTEDVYYEDLHMGRGQKVVLSLEAANVDPAVFSCPMDTEWSRRPNSHVAFGAGLHACPGAGLARQELQLIFRLLFHAAVDFQPTDITPIYRDNPNLGGLSSYYITIRSLGAKK